MRIIAAALALLWAGHSVAVVACATAFELSGSAARFVAPWHFELAASPPDPTIARSSSASESGKPMKKTS